MVRPESPAGGPMCVLSRKMTIQDFAEWKNGKIARILSEKKIFLLFSLQVINIFIPLHNRLRNNRFGRNGGQDVKKRL